jgi:hypothetical protein
LSSFRLLLPLSVKHSVLAQSKKPFSQQVLKALHVAIPSASFEKGILLLRATSTRTPSHRFLADPPVEEFQV